MKIASVFLKEIVNKQIGKKYKFTNLKYKNEKQILMYKHTEYQI